MTHGAPLLLELDLTGDLVDDPPTSPLAQVLARRRTAVTALVDALRDAAADPAVFGLVARVGSTRIPLTRAQELRDAVQAFRAAGKPAVAWAETIGEFPTGATVGYYLAAAFDEIWVQPSGDVGVTGTAVQTVFLGGLLDKSGVRAELGRRHEYKNAVDRLVQDHYTPAHREAAQRIADSVADQLVRAVADARQLDEPVVRELFAGGPLTAREALGAGLVDRLGYRDEVYRELRRRAGGTLTLRFASAYRTKRGLAQRVRRWLSAPSGRVALVHAAGTIRLGHSGRDAMGPAVGSDTLSAALRAAVRDPQVRAVVLRVNSPGGSYVASDAVWRAVCAAREQGRPVVVSMGELAASGGYFISMAADTIVAHPGTLTGSIGVFGGKLVIAEPLARYGITTDTVQTAANASTSSMWRSFTPAERDRLETALDRIYDDFVAKAAAGRRMTKEELHEVAKGRVWTGADARERGLVDELGGLRRAFELACAAAGLSTDAELRRYPSVPLAARVRRPRSSEDPGAAAAASGVGGLSKVWNAEPADAVGALAASGARGLAAAAYAAGWGELAAAAASLGWPVSGPLTMPDVRLR